MRYFVLVAISGNPRSRCDTTSQWQCEETAKMGPTLWATLLLRKLQAKSSHENLPILERWERQDMAVCVRMPNLNCIIVDIS